MLNQLTPTSKTNQMTHLERLSLADSLHTLAELFFNNKLVVAKHNGLCYHLDKLGDNDGYYYDAITEVMEELNFEHTYFEGRNVTEPFETRAYMALILSNYLKD